MNIEVIEKAIGPKPRRTKYNVPELEWWQKAAEHESARADKLQEELFECIEGLPR